MKKVSYQRIMKALAGSVRKWERIIAGKDRDQGVANCPLCKIFWERRLCAGCPVAEKTGKSSCDGSPYTKFVKACGYNAYPEPTAKRFKQLANAELRFLRKLEADWAGRY